eukprot:SRR837773.6829.p2 GENE.SRR837773.6829~~SRR837773.6829.p2  ORF type:complete len:119 (-),score=2.37 SRR837773.6829:103-459(-)
MTLPTIHLTAHSLQTHSPPRAPPPSRAPAPGAAAPASVQAPPPGPSGPLLVCGCDVRNVPCDNDAVILITVHIRFPLVGHGVLCCLAADQNRRRNWRCGNHALGGISMLTFCLVLQTA